MTADDIKRVLEARKAPNYLQAEDRAVDKLPEWRQRWLVRYFEENPAARVGIYSLRETAARTHMVAAAEVRKAADREAQEARERWWAELFRHDGEPRPAVYARSVHREPVPIHRQAPGTAPWPPEFIYDDLVPSAPAPTPRDLMLGAVPDLSPCTLPPRPPVVITRVR